MKKEKKSKYKETIVLGVVFLIIGIWITVLSLMPGGGIIGRHGNVIIVTGICYFLGIIMIIGGIYQKTKNIQD